MVTQIKADGDRPAAGLAPRVSGAVGLITTLALAASPFASADPVPQTRWWADAGIGAGTIAARHGSDSGGVWVDVILGGQLNERWRMGLELGGIGLHPSAGNYNTYNDSIYGETVTHSMLAVRYEPNANHGWLWGLSAGPAYYSNETLQDLTGNVRSGNGWAGMGTVGYDWRLGHGNGHVEAILNLEQGHVSLNAPVSAQFDYSTIAASVHMALH